MPQGVARNSFLGYATIKYQNNYNRYRPQFTRVVPVTRPVYVLILFLNVCACVCLCVCIKCWNIYQCSFRFLWLLMCFFVVVVLVLFFLQWTEDTTVAVGPSVMSRFPHLLCFTAQGVDLVFMCDFLLLWSSATGKSSSIYGGFI